MSQSNTNLVWVDLEMTGLCPETCVIVEVAMIITNRELKVIDKPLNIAVWQPPETLSRMEPYVADMHKKSGLMPRIEKSRVSLAGAEKLMMEMMTKHCAYGTAPLCGNTIGQDRRFLVKYMPQVDGYLHYRNIDVSTVKELGLWWYGAKYIKPDDGKHTALHDIQQSIEEMRYLRGSVFK